MAAVDGEKSYNRLKIFRGGSGAPANKPMTVSVVFQTLFLWTIIEEQL